MTEILETKELSDIPLAERRLTLNGHIMTVSFTIIADLDFDITLRKVFASHQDAINAYNVFSRHDSTSQLSAWKENIPFQQQQQNARIELLQKLASKQLPLPEQGDGFVYDGDLSYINQMIKALSAT